MFRGAVFSGHSVVYCEAVRSAILATAWLLVPNRLERNRIPTSLEFAVMLKISGALKRETELRHHCASFSYRRYVNWNVASTSFEGGFTECSWRRESSL